MTTKVCAARGRQPCSTDPFSAPACSDAGGAIGETELPWAVIHDEYRRAFPTWAYRSWP